MAIISFNSQTTGLIGDQVNPRRVSIVSTDNLATVTTAGYLNNMAKTFPIFPTDVIEMRYSYSEATGSSTYGIFLPVFSGNADNRTITLDAWENPGNVLLPVVSNNFANFNGTSGQIKDSGYSPSNASKTKVVMLNAASTNNQIAVFSDTNGTISSGGNPAVNPGTIQAGLTTGTQGILVSMPGSATTGALQVAAQPNAGDFTVEIRNASHGQATVYSIPDAGQATSEFIIADSAGTQHITSGSLEVDAGNLIAGSSGAAGTVSSFPSTAANGSLVLAATNAGGAFNTTISNGTMGQATVYTIPDVAAATGQFLAKTAALVNGNLVQASGTAGVCVDSGVATSNVQLKTEIKAATTANIGGAGAGPITVTVAGLTAASVVVATIATSSNVVSVAKAVAGSGNFDVTFSGDPGATCTLNYVAYIASQ